MKPDDRMAFLEVVIGLAELKGKALSAPGLELYWRSMQHWELADFRAAAEQLVRACAFMPTPKDFEDLRRAARPSAGEAWAEVLDYVRNGPGPSGLVAYDHVDKPPTDPVLLAAVRAIGGFPAIAMSKTDQTPFLERRFAEHYEAIGDREEARQAVPSLMREAPRAISGPRVAAHIGLVDDSTLYGDR